MKKYFFLLLIFVFLCVGCGNKTIKDSVKFKQEYEQYNGEYLEIEISDANLIAYSDVLEVNNLLKDGTGVVYIGSPKDNVSRRAISVLLDVVLNSGLEKVYYVDTLDGIEDLDGIIEKSIPLVLFVVDGEIVKYHVGTIDNKVDLGDDELVLLYNTYAEGLTLVLSN